MTLQRQLLITILVLFVCMFMGTVLISGYLGRMYFERQLTTHARDTATSLGLLLSTHMEKNDVAMATSMIDTVFDRGYYQSIQLYDRSGKLSVDRRSTLRIDQVPNWFVQLVDYHTSTAVATIMSGWKQAGTIKVRSHPGYAYQELWMSTVVVFGWFLTLAFIIFAIGVLVINYLFRPIHLIAAHAKSISSGVLPERLPLPKPSQLRQVTVAMNHMTESLKKIFNAQQQEAIDLRNQLYQDFTSGVYNRLYFSNYILHQITLSEAQVRLKLIAVKILGFENFNENNLFFTDDEFLQHVARKLADAVVSRPHSFVCRVNESSFVILSGLWDASYIKELTSKISSDLKQLITQEADEDALSFCLGVTTLQSGMTEQEIFMRMNKSLLKNSVRTNQNQSRLSEAESSTECSGDVFDEILEENTIGLYQQPVYTETKASVSHHALHIRAADKTGRWHSELYIQLLAVQKEERARLDHFRFSSMRRFLEVSHANHRYAVALSLPRIESSDFNKWLDLLQSELGLLAKQLIFEVPEKLVINNVQSFRALSQYAIESGGAVAISHFGASLSNFTYLLDIPLAYVKLDPSLTQRVQYSDENQHYVQSLIRVAKTLGILVLAEGIEDEVNLDLLRSFGIDLFQGHFLQPIERVEIV